MDEFLCSARLVIRLIEEQDLPKRVEWINDPLVQANLNFGYYPVSLARTKQWFQRVLKDETRRDFSIFTTEGEYIGFCGFTDISWRHRKAERYTIIGDRSFWRQGLGTEVIQLMEEYGFKELGLNKIYSHHTAHNEGIHRIMEKLGYRTVGLLRDDLFVHGHYQGRYLCELLREDWLNRKQDEAKAGTEEACSS